MKNILRILLALLVLASAVTLTAQVKQDKCPTCGKPYSQCSYHFNHPAAPKKCSTCGKTLDKCQYKGRHPAKCSTCGKTVDKCQYSGKHPKCSTCGKIVDKCQYGGTHPKCSTCGRIIDNCQYGGYHPKCSTCGKVVENCQHSGNHPKCPTCGKIVDNCQYGGYHPKCTICGKIVDNCEFGGKTPIMTKEQSAVINDLVASMVWIEGGTFTMGATREQGSAANVNEKPAHQVTLSGFYMCKYEVTQELWQAVMGTTVRQQRDKAKSWRFFGEGANYPMYNISWEECQTFINKLNHMTGMVSKRYRLPTEAEWEYAARGGNKSRGYKYAGSNTLDNVAWYDDNSGRTTHPVGQKSPNELGLYDMSGNVYEWCQDWCRLYNSGSLTDPSGPPSGKYRVIRGGVWDNYSEACRVSHRYYNTPNYSGAVGLRLAASSL